MRPILVVLGLTLAAFCADEPANVALLPCGQGGPGGPNCNPSKKELKEAKAAYVRALKLQQEKRGDEALEEFSHAAQLSPRDVDYVTAREMARQQLVYEHLERGNTELLKGQQVEALAEFRNALQLDPENQFAQQRLRDAIGEWTPRAEAMPQVLADAGELRVVPSPARADFHYRGDSRGLLTQVAAAFGVVATLDDSVPSRRVGFDIQGVDFYAAMDAACNVTKTFWTPLEEKQVLLAAQSAENHRQYDRMALRTFFIPGITTPQELQEIVNVLRTVFEIRFITPQPQTGTLVVRAPQAMLDAATQMLATLGDGRAQVILDVHVYEVTRTLVHNLGLHIPNQFQLFNIPAGALAALGGQNIQDLINQLIAGGGINQAGSQALSALLAQLSSQQNSIFSQPLATFGGGLTLMGLSLGTASAQLSVNESSVKNLEHATLRVADGNEANFKVGSRFPILNASFAPIFNTPAIAQNIQNNTFQAAFPSFSYEDLGLTMKAKPQVNGNLDVSLALEMQFRSLTGGAVNGVPVISNREYKGSMMLRDGEPAVVAGSVSHTEQRSLAGIPGLGQVPGLNQVMTTNTKEEDDDELLVVITPHVVRQVTGINSEVWLKK
ncbi:MAG: type II and III secretion system protein [Acidobacteriia bacterium]|nr:type II and III secretion system protein [Terriglobia bacterium]